MGEKSRDKFKKQIHSRITNMFEKTLDFVEVACASKDSYKALRSKILGLGNDCIRSLKKDLDYYEVEYKATGEEVVEFQQAKSKE